MLKLLALSLAEDSEEANTYQTVQTRLALAADNLALNPQIAGADLETAWDVLDEILTTRLLPEREELELGLGVGLETAVPFDAEQTPTPQSTPTLMPEITPTPEVSN